MSYKVILISIIHRKNKSEILLVRRNREPGYDKWSLPGGIGALENEPDPTLANSEEVFGEFGTSIVDPKIFRLKYTAKPEPTLHLYFHGELEGEPEIYSPKTTKELSWVPLSKVLRIDLAFKEVDMEVLNQFEKEFSKIK
ncbi:MAG: NUDIX domain-containing protein [Candidatus Moraniibacteriota bacterium]